MSHGIKKVIWILITSAVLIGVLYLALPLFVDREVHEDFPSPEELAQMSPEERAQMAEEVEMRILELSAQMPPTIVTEGMPVVVGGAETTTTLESTVEAEGEFADADRFHKGSGSATIYTLAGGQQILRLEDFEVTNGPDLHVLLVPHADPMSRDDIREGEYIDLGSLKGNKGDQNYTIPDDVDVGQFGSVVIYCEPFHVIFSTATLQ